MKPARSSRFSTSPPSSRPASSPRTSATGRSARSRSPTGTSRSSAKSSSPAYAATEYLNTMLKHWVILAAVGFAGAAARGQEPDGAAPPRSRPMLEQLDRESQDLYEDVRQQMV